MAGQGGEEDQMSGRVGWRRGEENRWDGVWRWKGKVRDEKIRRAENDQEVGRRWGAEEARAAGEETGGEEGWVWDRYFDFLWAIRPEWAADKGKCVSLRFGQLWIGQEEFLWDVPRGGLLRWNQRAAIMVLFRVRKISRVWLTTFGSIVPDNMASSSSEAFKSPFTSITDATCFKGGMF